MWSAGLLVILFAAGTMCFRRVNQPQLVAPTRQDCLTQPGPWSQCSAQCGGGIRTRTLQIIRRPFGYGARQCPTQLSESEPCNLQPCQQLPRPVDCQVEYGVFGACSATCGQGVQIRQDRIIRQAENGGRACPSYAQLRTTRPCRGLPVCEKPVHCEIGYTPYTLCTRPCGGGVQTRTAFIVTKAKNGGAPCPEDLTAFSDTRQCNVDIPCSTAKNCEFVTGEFGECSVQCGRGIQTRKVYIVAEPSEGGLPCPGELVETRPCTGPQGPCPSPQDCIVEYPSFSQCSATCGGGSQSTTGRVVKQATAGGSPCPSYADLTITRTCGTTPCIQITPRNCEIEYGAYSECSASCGTGYRTRRGYIKHEAENGGTPCPPLSQLIQRELCSELPACHHGSYGTAQIRSSGSFSINSGRVSSAQSQSHTSQLIANARRPSLNIHRGNNNVHVGSSFNFRGYQ